MARVCEEHHIFDVNRQKDVTNKPSARWPTGQWPPNSGGHCPPSHLTIWSFIFHIKLPRWCDPPGSDRRFFAVTGRWDTEPMSCWFMSFCRLTADIVPYLSHITGVSHWVIDAPNITCTHSCQTLSRGGSKWNYTYITTSDISWECQRRDWANELSEHIKNNFVIILRAICGNFGKEGRK